MTHPSPARQGAVMIVVLGLITIILGLLLGLTVKVYNNLKSGTATQQNAQAWIMMQAARMYLLAYPPSGSTNYAFTLGDLQPGDLPGKELDDRLGWARIRQIAAADSVYVLACGGSSGSGGKVAITDGPPVRNAMDVRYLYRMDYMTAPAASWTWSLLPAEPANYVDQTPAIPAIW